jgi:hypothetical protein
MVITFQPPAWRRRPLIGMVAAPVGGVIRYDEYVLVLNHRLTTGAERAKRRSYNSGPDDLVRALQRGSGPLQPIRTSNHRAPVASAQVAPLR